MKAIAKVLLLVGGVCFGVPSESILQCLSDIREIESRYQKFPPALAVKLDPGIEENLKALVQLENEKRRSNAITSDFTFLMHNAVETCESYRAELSGRFRRFSTFLTSAVLSLIGLLLYLVLYGIPFVKRAMVSLLILSSASSFAEDHKLVVYTYDSFASKGSFGEKLAEEAKKKQLSIEYVRFPSSGEALNQILLEGPASKADVVVGIDNGLLFKAKGSGLFEKFDRKLIASIDKAHLFDPDLEVLPFDYGYLAFVYDRSRSPDLKAVRTLKALSEQVSLKRRVVIADPRTSSLGLGLLLWTKTVFQGDGYRDFWQTFSDKLVTIAPGWSAAYGLFLKKEADLVLSYTTSPAYHEEVEKSTSFDYLVFSEGHYRQVEGFARLKSSKRQAEAGKFAELLLSQPVQSMLPQLQWMYPVNRKAKIPQSFKRRGEPKAISVSKDLYEQDKAPWFRQWALIVSEKK